MFKTATCALIVILLATTSAQAQQTQSVKVPAFGGVIPCTIVETGCKLPVTVRDAVDSSAETMKRELTHAYGSIEGADVQGLIQYSQSFASSESRMGIQDYLNRPVYIPFDTLVRVLFKGKAVLREVSRDGGSALLAYELRG